MVLDSVWLVRPGVLRHVTTFDRGGALLILRPFSACMEKDRQLAFGITRPENAAFSIWRNVGIDTTPIFTTYASHLAASDEVVGCFYKYATFQTLFSTQTQLTILGSTLAEKCAIRMIDLEPLRCCISCLLPLSGMAIRLDCRFNHGTAARVINIFFACSESPRRRIGLLFFLKYTPLHYIIYTP